MAQKKYKNPIAFFREANEARQAKVKKSIKKAEYGISMGEDPENMLINKPGYGAKKSVTTSVNDTQTKPLILEMQPPSYKYPEEPGYVSVKVGEKKLFSKRPVIQMKESEIKKISDENYKEWLKQNQGKLEEKRKKYYKSLKNDNPLIRKKGGAIKRKKK
jgi:hypothetical protein